MSTAGRSLRYINIIIFYFVYIYIYVSTSRTSANNLLSSLWKLLRFVISDYFQEIFHFPLTLFSRIFFLQLGRSIYDVRTSVMYTWLPMWVDHDYLWCQHFDIQWHRAHKCDVSGSHLVSVIFNCWATLPTGTILFGRQCNLLLCLRKNNNVSAGMWDKYTFKIIAISTQKRIRLEDKIRNLHTEYIRVTNTLKQSK